MSNRANQTTVSDLEKAFEEEHGTMISVDDAYKQAVSDVAMLHAAGKIDASTEMTLLTDLAAMYFASKFQKIAMEKIINYFVELKR